MAFDSTLSGTAANSYIDLTTADAFFTLHLDGSYWTALPTATKQAALVQATNRLDMEVFGGRPTVDGQRLQWPRSFVVDRNQYYQENRVQVMGGQYYIDSTVQPKELQDAVCEMALHLLKIKEGDFTVDENDLETLASYKVGPIDVTIKPNLKADRLPSKVKSLLKAIGLNAWSGEKPLTYVR